MKPDVFEEIVIGDLKPEIFVLSKGNSILKKKNIPKLV